MNFETVVAEPETRKVTGHGGNPPGQGPFMRISLEVEGDVIREATYETYLCPVAHECGKALCDLVRGRSVVEAAAIDRPALAARVGPLPRAKSLNLSLAVVALTDALRQLHEDPERRVSP